MSIRLLHHLIIITIMLTIAIAEIQETESTNYIVVELKEMAFMPMHTLVDAVPVYFCHPCRCNVVMYCNVLSGVVPIDFMKILVCT